MPNAAPKERNRNELATPSSLRPNPPPHIIRCMLHHLHHHIRRFVITLFQPIRPRLHQRIRSDLQEQAIPGRIVEAAWCNFREQPVQRYLHRSHPLRTRQLYSQGQPQHRQLRSEERSCYTTTPLGTEGPYQGIESHSEHTMLRLELFLGSARGRYQQ